jgi:hypothetical protein
VTRVEVIGPMSRYLLKAADRAAAVGIDWRQGYLAPGETVEADLGWHVHDDAGGTLVVAEQRHDAARSSASLTGGVPGRVYMLAGRVRTSAGRRLERTVVVRIAAASD